MITARSVSKSFNSTIAVHSIDLSVEKGEVFGLVGPDGAGKTTTMRMLASIMHPDSGRIFIDGLDTISQSEHVKEHIGYMSQRFGLYPDLTVMENIDFYADIYGVSRRDRTDRIERLLSFSNLTPFKKRQAGKLSGGMKQKLGLACALVHTPRVLLLDEPTNGVDPVSRRDFWRILNSLLKDGVTIFVSTAYLDEAERCTRVALMNKGRIVACDSPANIKSKMANKLIELKCENIRAAARLLEAEGLKSGLFGDRIHIACHELSPCEEDVKTILARAGFKKVEFRQIEPSLEDVFLSFLDTANEGVNRA